MARREDIRVALYEELLSIADGRAIVTVDFTEADEASAAIYYDGTERPRPLNEGSAGPDHVHRDDQGRVIEQVYVTHLDYVADVSVMVDDDTLQERIYQDVREGLQKYTHEGWDYEDFHEHVERFRVADMSDATDVDTTSIMRGDTVQAVIGYVSGLVKQVEPIDTVGGDVDANEDVDNTEPYDQTTGKDSSAS
jgi:hypothetical protein